MIETNIDPELIVKMAEKKWGGMRPEQQVAVETFKEVINNNKNMLFSAPTGLGKTLVAFDGIIRIISEGKRAIMLSALKALTSEQFEELEKILEKTGNKLNVIILDGDNRDNQKRLRKEDWDILVMTYEMADSMMRNPNKRPILINGSRSLGVVVIDEIHTVGSSGRGPNLESFILTVLDKCPEVKIMGLSATIGNVIQFSDWMNAKLVHFTERPIELKKDIYTYTNAYNYKINQQKKYTILSNIFREFNDVQHLVFCSSRSRCSQLKNYFENLEEFDNMEFAFHHAGLDKDIKKKVEKGFKNNDINVIFCTPTLAQGVNLPADVVTLFDVQRFSYLLQEPVMIDANEIIQMIGRAGRPGMSKLGYGMAIAICEDFDYDEVKQRMEEALTIESRIPPMAKEKFLSFFVSGLAKTEEDIISIASNKLINNSISEEEVKEDLLWLFENGFYEKNESGMVRVTPLGFKTIAFYIKPSTALHFVTEVIKICDEIGIDNLTPLDLYRIVLNCEEFLKDIIVKRQDDEIIDACSKLIREQNEGKTIESYGMYLDTRILKALGFTFSNYIKEKYDMDIISSNSDKFILKNSSKRILQASIYIIPDKKFEKKINLLIQMIDTGTLDENVVKLMELKNIGYTRANLLIKAGIKSSIGVLKLSDIALSKIIKVNKNVAQQIKNQLIDSISKNKKFSKKNQEKKSLKKKSKQSSLF